MTDKKRDVESWPNTVRSRAKELWEANTQYKEVRKQVDALEMMDAGKPALLMEAGRKLHRLAECYQALAKEIAYYQSTKS